MSLDWQSLPMRLDGRQRCLMPTRNVNLTNEQDKFVAERVKSGQYANASEVIRTGLRLLEREERAYEEKMAALQKAIQDGLDSGIAEPGVFEKIREKFNLPNREKCA